MLHRAVMTMVLGRQLGRDEFVCHRDDDAGNNWPENLYLGGSAEQRGRLLAEWATCAGI